MKTPEDEAFDELAQRQGMWGGGFQAKRAAAADKLKPALVWPENKTFSHWSDCAVHNGPAYPAGPCDCGVAQEPAEWLTGCPTCGMDAGCDCDTGTWNPPQPVQEPVAEVVWGAKTDFEWEFKMLVELACVEDVPVKLYAGEFKGAAVYWHDTETDKGTTPPKRERVLFPTMLRKMWSGGEVQAWLDENVNKEQNNG
jgi:hypothetical protein